MIAIVCDSTINLTKQEASDLGVHIVPMTYTVSGRVFHESYTDTNGSFERNVSNYKCTTSQPSAAAFMSTFEELRRKGYQILCLVISSRLSGAYSSALLAAREVDGQNIRVVDSRTVSGGIKIMTEYANEFITQNLSLDDIALKIENLRDKIVLAFSVENMDPLRRSGRLGFVRQSISTILNMRPILKCVEGTIISYDFSKGRQQQIAKLAAAIPKDAQKINVISLGADASAEKLCDLVKSEFPSASPKISTVGPVLAIHLGLPALGVVWINN